MSFAGAGPSSSSSSSSFAPPANDPRVWAVPPPVPPPVGPPLARSPVSGGSSSGQGNIGFPFLFEGAGGLGAAMQDAVERSLPPTPRSPSPTCSPPSSPKRKAQNREDEAKSGELSAAEEDLETRAAALGLHEVERRVWKETALPPTPSSPSPTFSPPSSPKTKQRQAELALLTAEQAAVKLAASLDAMRSSTMGEGSRSCDSRCDSDSDAMAEAEVASALAAWEAANGAGSGSGSGGGGSAAGLPPHLSLPNAMPGAAPLFKHPYSGGGSNASRKKRQL